MSIITTTPLTPAIPASRRRRTGFLAVTGAVAATLAGWAVAPEAARTIRMGTGARISHVGPALIAVATLLAGLGAWMLLAALIPVLARTAPRPLRPAGMATR